MSETRSISAWWLLLLLPVAPAVGWLVGAMPVPGPRAQNAVDSQVATAAATSAASSHPAESGAPPDAGMAPWESGSGASPTAQSSGEARPGGEARSVEGARPGEEARPVVVSQWTSLPIAMVESERNGKPVLIDFNADWCPPCQMLKRQVFEDGEFGQRVQTAVIPVSIVDRRREEGRNTPEIDQLQQRFSINSFPTLIVYSPATGRSLRTSGYAGAEATVAWIAQAADAVR